METSPDSIWIAETATGVVVARMRAGEALLVVDRPALGRFREKRPLAIQGDSPVVDDVALHRVSPLPSRMSEVSGWYEDGDGRTLLLTHFPEPYFGEPMILVAEGDRVTRAYALGETRMLTEDGMFLELDDDGLRVTSDYLVTTLRRSPRFREHYVTFYAGDDQLAGTVIIPAGSGPHPAAVFLPGAAGGQRDFGRLHVRPLLEAGVAVLLFDKAGHGFSDGTDPSIFDQATAANAAMRLLAGLSEIDSTRIGLAGFSNGMWAVPMAAARAETAFIAGVGAPGVSMAEAEVHRRTKVLRESGISPGTVAAVGDAWRCIFAIVGEGRSAAVEQRLDRALTVIGAAADLDAYEIPDFVRENPMLSPIPPLMPVADLVGMLDDVRDPQVAYDPATDYEAVGCPVFLQYGSDDTSVPVEASIERIERAVAEAGQNVTVKVYHGLEHLLNVLPKEVTGLTPEGLMYGFHRFRYGDGALTDLTEWLRATL